MPSAAEEPILLAFVGHAAPGRADDAAAFEDAVLPLLADHGARVVFRGRRRAGQDPALPFEVHLLWFPDRGAFEGYLADARRTELLERFGDVFAVKQAVEIDTVSTGDWP